MDTEAMKARDDFFDQLEKRGVNISEAQKKNINTRLQSILQYEPKIGVFGKTGVGKSSLCNALFGKDICPISDVEACTRDPKDVLLHFGDGEKGIKLVDVPGVGESSIRDEEYASLYASLLPELDLVLWLIKADDRAMASDENFYRHIVKPHIDEGKPFFFVLNQVDKIEPFREWDEERHEPSDKQFQNIHRKADDVASFFNVAPSKVIPVSANERYNLTKLVDEFIRALPAEKKVTVFKAVDDEFQSKATGEHVKTSFLDVIGDAVCSFVETATEVVSTIISGIAETIFDHIPFLGGGDGCYITTAVCDHQNKPDDCYELTMFRKFRDNWLAHQSNEKDLIYDYYQVAPTIVKLIDQKENSIQVYDEIYQEYLIPCLHYIEDGEYESCEICYENMVNKLCEEYLLWH